MASFMRMAVIGIPELVASLAAATVATQAMQPTALQKAGFLVERRAKQIVVEKDIVDTGNLLGLIATQAPEGNSIEIASQADYSIYNEYGTYRMAARPYMRPALSESQAAIEKLIGAMFVSTVYGAMAGGGKWATTVETMRVNPVYTTALPSD